jgi:predicted TIM-barrel fold metal-dependent hydrolase
MAAALMLVPSLTAQEAAKLEIIDTHTHFYDPRRPEGVPWPEKGNKLLYRPVLPEELKKLARPFGVAGTIVVEASPWVEDNQWLLDLAAKEPFLVGVVGNLDPKSDDFEKNLRRFARKPLFRGIRISHQQLTSGLTKRKLVQRFKLLADLNLALDVIGGPDMPADVARLAAELPALRIVINHAANLWIDGQEPPALWRAGMQAAAKHPKVFCKVSGIVGQTGRKQAPGDVNYYRPVLDSLWNLFGEDRLMFGSNWPVSDAGAPYETVVRIARDYFATKGEQAALKFFRANSQAAYRWRKR